MKLVILTAIKEYDAEIKKQLKKALVTTFTFKEVSGYRDSTGESIENNWFSSEMNVTESIMYYAFVQNEKADNLLENVNEFNAKKETPSQIHIAILNIEESN